MLTSVCARCMNFDMTLKPATFFSDYSWLDMIFVAFVVNEVALKQVSLSFSPLFLH